MVKPVFRSQFGEHEHFLTNPGNREKTLFAGSYNSDGTVEIRETGKEDLYGYIQSHKDSVDIHVLLKRYQNGETDVMQRVQGFYGDVTELPDTYAGVLDVIQKANTLFAQLPADKRAMFHNNPEEFIAALDNSAVMASVFGTADDGSGVVDQPVVKVDQPVVKEEKKDEP